ncbi:hypothetical protein PLACP1_10100 [Planifilum fimeticola]
MPFQREGPPGCKALQANPVKVALEQSCRILRTGSRLDRFPTLEGNEGTGSTCDPVNKGGTAECSFRPLDGKEFYF